MNAQTTPLLPSADQQLVFLTKIQRLFSEGDFTATYKFALLIALCDLVVEWGRERVGEVRLEYADIADKFILLYWNHTLPYSQAGGKPMVLMQSHGVQAAVISAIQTFKEECRITNLSVAQRHLRYGQLVKKVAAVVSSQPAQYLQNIGGVTDNFLFDRVRGGVKLSSNAVYCLRQFQPLIQQLARQRWVDHIKSNKLNVVAVGSDNDLFSFLFKTSRQSLAAVYDGLREILGGKCFYCDSAVRNEGHVDHFIPFSIYPRDLIHNFVFTHAECNLRKSDALAALRHLNRWLEFSSAHSSTLQEIGVSAGIPGCLRASVAVSEWAYTSAAQAGGRAWIQGRDFEPITPSYVQIFSSSGS